MVTHDTLPDPGHATVTPPANAGRDRWRPTIFYFPPARQADAARVITRLPPASPRPPSPLERAPAPRAGAETRDGSVRPDLHRWARSRRPSPSRATPGVR